jgi:hypothetical protein
MDPSVPRHRREQGASIVLAFLVFLILLVVVFQVFFSSQVELDRTAQAVGATQMRWLADACRIQAISVLLVDLEDASEGEEEEAGGGDDGGGTPFGDAGGGGGAASALDIVGTTDSLLDEWKNSAALAPALGEGLTLHVEVIDEDSKINLLGLWTEDEEQREIWREVFGRLLDEAFEGSSLDISSFDTADLLDALDDWVTGDRRDLFERREPPRLKLTDAQDEEASDVDSDIIENDEVHFPMTLGELIMVEGLQLEHLDGFVEDDVYYPGLRDYLTVWTHLELKAPPPEEDPFADSPLGGSDDEEEPEPSGGIQSGQTANNGLVNCNTAPLMVLRALAPEDIPTAFLERVIEFREQIHELQDEFADMGETDDWGDDEDEEAAEGEEEEELDEDDPAFYVFQEPDDVFTKVEDQWDLSVFTEDSEKDLFTSRLAVTSEVFTIKITILDPQTGRRGSYRSVVWRLDEGERPSIVPLLPLEEYHDPRRMQDLPEDIQDVSDERFERPFERR